MMIDDNTTTLWREFLNNVNMALKQGRIMFDTLDDDPLAILLIKVKEQEETVLIETKDDSDIETTL